MNKVQITINSQVDRAVIAADIAAGSFNIDVINNFNPGEIEATVIDVASFDTTTAEAFKKVLDALVFPIEENGFIFRINKVTKTFSLYESYFRDVTSTVKPVTPIDDGTPLNVRFEIPGFSSNNFRNITLFYNQAFNPADVALLLEIGIVLTGDGLAFTIANDVECKVSFSKPVGSTELYIIDNPFLAQIITP